MPEDKKVEKKVEEKAEVKKEQTVKEPTIITVDDVLKELNDISGVTTKEKKSGWITVRDTKNRAYIKNAKYGVTVWSIKANKTLPIKTKEDVKGFVASIKAHTKKE